MYKRFFPIGCYLVTCIWLKFSYLGFIPSSEFIFSLVSKFVIALWVFFLILFFSMFDFLLVVFLLVFWLGFELTSISDFILCFPQSRQSLLRNKLSFIFYVSIYWRQRSCRDSSFSLVGVFFLVFHDHIIIVFFLDTFLSFFLA